MCVQNYFAMVQSHRKMDTICQQTWRPLNSLIVISAWLRKDKAQEHA